MANFREAAKYMLMALLGIIGLWIALPVIVPIGIIVIFGWLLHGVYGVLKRCFGRHEYLAKIMVALIGFAIFISVWAIIEAWGERHFIVVFSESFAAIAFLGVCIGCVIGGIIGGYFVKEYVSCKTSREWLGVILGVAIFVAAAGVGITTYFNAPKIIHRGVASRFNQMFNNPNEYE